MQAPEAEDFGEKIKKLKADVSPEAVELVINTAFYYMREHADTETKQPFINIVRQFIQKVVIGRPRVTSRHHSKCTAGSLPSLRPWRQRRSWRGSSRHSSSTTI